MRGLTMAFLSCGSTGLFAGFGRMGRARLHH